MTTLSEHIKLLRKEKQINQATLADELDVGKTTLAAYEQGRCEPNNETLIKMANYFNVSTDYLLGNSIYRNIEEEFQISSTISLPENDELCELYKKIASVYAQLLKAYDKQGLQPSCSNALFNQMLRSIHYVTDSYHSIDLKAAETTEDLVQGFGQIMESLTKNTIDSSLIFREMLRLYYNKSETE